MFVQQNFSTIGHSAKYLVSGVAGLVLLNSSSPAPLYYIFAACLNAILSKVLKMLLRMPRPRFDKFGRETSRNDGIQKKEGFGMPSSHAQSLFYFLIVLSVTLVRFHTWVSYVGIIFFGIYAFVASYWRVTAGLHSISQTFVGCCCGTAVGILTVWFEQFFSGSYNFVPLWSRVTVATVGASVLYSKEILNFYKMSKKNHKLVEFGR